MQPKEDFELYVKPVPLAKDGRFDLRFDFNLHNGATNNPSGFDLVLGDGKRTFRMPVTAASVAGVRQEPLVPNWVWKGLLLKADGAKGEVYLATDRKFAKIGEVKFGFRPTAFNFAVTSNRNFAITKIVATTPQAVPEFPAAAHFASFKSLSQPLAGAKVAAAGEKVAIPVAEKAGIAFKPNGVEKLGKAVVTYEDGSTRDFPLELTAQDQNLRIAMLGKNKKDKIVLPDCGLNDEGDEAQILLRSLSWCVE